MTGPGRSSCDSTRLKMACRHDDASALRPPTTAAWVSFSSVRRYDAAYCTTHHSAPPVGSDLDPLRYGDVACKRTT